MMYIRPRSVFHSGSEMLIGVRDAAVVLFFEVVVRKIGITAAAEPKLFNELLTLFVRVQLQESLALFRRDDIDSVLVEPLLVGSVQLLERLLHLSLLFFVELLRSGRWIRISRVLC